MGLFQKGMSSLFYAILRGTIGHFIIKAENDKEITTNAGGCQNGKIIDA